jgi:hypothetical protein
MNHHLAEWRKGLSEAFRHLLQLLDQDSLFFGWVRHLDIISIIGYYFNAPGLDACARPALTATKTALS